MYDAERYRIRVTDDLMGDLGPPFLFGYIQYAYSVYCIYRY